MERESMEFDVLIVGGGPAGLSAAIRLKQLAKESGKEIEVCLLEKGAEIGAHILSGAVFEPRTLNELIPDWKSLGAPLDTPVTEDQVFYLNSPESGKRLPNALIPKTMHNEGNYIVSLGNVCRWLGEQAEEAGVDIFPGFPAAEILYGDKNQVQGVITGDMGRSASGVEKDSFEAGMELRAKYTLFAEGCRGHLGKELIAKYQLDADSDPQHYGLGIKELWDIEPEKHQAGLVVHGAGWPLKEAGASGGFFLYHAADNQVSVGLITDLNFDNPHLSPYEEFQRFKNHPEIKQYLEGGKRISYGARALAKGGLNSLPKQHFSGGLLIGCDAGTMISSKIKGSHSAMKSGMIGAEVVFEAITSGDEGGSDLIQYSQAFRESWLYEEMYRDRNFGPALHKLGFWLGGSFNYIDQNWCGGKLPLTLRDCKPDHLGMKLASDCKLIAYPKPDGILSFDRLSSVFLSNTNHEEDQPCHLTLNDSVVPIAENLVKYASPEQRYCPAGVYEIIDEGGGIEPLLQINSQNCLHCKTCDIKDPTQNIEWISPEGTGGPNYPNM